MFYAEAKAGARESQSQTHGQLLLCLCSLPLPPSRDRLHDVVCVPDTIVATGPCCLPEIPSFLESRRKKLFPSLNFWVARMGCFYLCAFVSTVLRSIGGDLTSNICSAVCLCEMHPLPPTPLSTNRTEIDPILTHLQNGNVVKTSRHCLTVLLC